MATVQEFTYLSIALIVINQQIRSTIDTASESFLAFVESIKLYGILEPLIVMPLDDGTYRLICGERRFLAAQAIGLTEVPVTFIPAGTSEAEITALQITENMQRQDLNPIDMADGIQKYLHIKHADGNYGPIGSVEWLTRYERRPEDVPRPLADTVSAISRITGNSVRTLIRIVSLLKLEDELKEALKTNKLTRSQGYIFAAHLDNPNRMKIFESIMATPVTNAVLEKMLAATTKAKPATAPAPAINLSRQHRSMNMMKETITKNSGKYVAGDLQKLVDELQAVIDLAKAELAKASGGSGAGA